MDTTKRLLERIDEELDRIPTFWSGLSMVGDKEKFPQWRQNVWDYLESFDEEYESKYREDFNAIWQLADMRIPPDGIWEKDCFMESFHLLHKVRSELLLSDRLMSFQPVLKNYIRTSSLRECSDDEIADLIKGLENICAAENASTVELAVHGRKVAAACAKRISGHLKLRPTNQAATLNDYLNLIEGHLIRRGQGYIASYLRLLQSCGNISAHEIDSELTLIDRHAILGASVRMLQYASSLPQ